MGVKELTSMLANFPPVPVLYMPKCKRFGEPKPPRTTPKIGRNAPCPCGCGKKHKKCANKSLKVADDTLLPNN